jgi:hypothetical protein
MSNKIADLPRVQPTETSSEATYNNLTSSPLPASNQAAKLPYQATHQVELLHLHAEIEALLQQVRTLKQQRLEVDDYLVMDEAEQTPALAIR